LRQLAARPTGSDTECSHFRVTVQDLRRLVERLPHDMRRDKASLLDSIIVRRMEPIHNDTFLTFHEDEEDIKCSLCLFVIQIFDELVKRGVIADDVRVHDNVTNIFANHFVLGRAILDASYDIDYYNHDYDYHVGAGGAAGTSR